MFFDPRIRSEADLSCPKALEKHGLNQCMHTSQHKKKADTVTVLQLLQYETSNR